MSELPNIVVGIVIGLFALSKGSDWLTDSIVPVAKRLGTSHISVSLILVSILVSLPEIIVSLLAVYLGHPVVGLGVVFGSVMCNIGLMTGFIAWRKTLHLDRQVIVRDGVFAVVFAVVVMAVAQDGVINRFEGLALFLLFIPYIITVWEEEKLKTQETRKKELEETIVELDLVGLQTWKMRAGVFTFVLGSVLLLSGAYFFTEGMTSFARVSGISDIIIGLTLGAIGPSVPNVIAAYKAGRRDLDNVVVSETLGSNIFTLLVTLGVLSLAAPLTIERTWIVFDIPAMVVMSIMLLFFMVTNRKVTRAEGGILFFTYLVVLATQVILYGF